jgi:biotin carboxyl carrier protein
MKYITTIDDREFEIEIDGDNKLVVDGKLYFIDFNSIGDQPVYSLLINGQSYEAYVYPTEDDWQVLLFGRFYPVKVEDERERRLRLASGNVISERQEYALKSPMPGLIVDVPVSVGQNVETGDVLIVLESMKMQNELKSPRAGVVSRISVGVRDSVEQRQLLMIVE